MKNQHFPLNSVAEIKLSYHPIVRACERPKVSESYELYQLILANWDMGLIELQEEFKLVLLNRSSRVIGISSVSKGGVSGTVVDPKIVFGIALKAGASAMMLVHNHPSGNLSASAADLAITRKLVAGGVLLEIDVFDHLIITMDGYLSLADEGLM